MQAQSKTDTDVKTQIKRKDAPPNKIKLEKPSVEKTLNTDQKEFPPLPKPQQPGNVGVQVSESVPDLLPASPVVSKVSPTRHSFTCTSSLEKMNFNQIPSIVQMPFIQGQKVSLGDTSSTSLQNVSTLAGSGNISGNMRPMLSHGGLAEGSPMAGPRVGMKPSQIHLRPSFDPGISVPPNIAQLFGTGQIIVPGVQLSRFPAKQNSTSPLTVGEDGISSSRIDYTPVGSPYSGLENASSLPNDASQMASSPVSLYSGRIIHENKIRSPTKEHSIPNPNFSQPPPESARQFVPPQQNMYVGLGHPPFQNKDANMPGIGMVPNDRLHPLQDAAQMQQFLQQMTQESVPHNELFDDPVSRSHNQHPKPLPGFTNPPPPIQPNLHDKQSFVRSSLMGANLNIPRMIDSSTPTNPALEGRSCRQNNDTHYMDTEVTRGNVCIIQLR